MPSQDTVALLKAAIQGAPIALFAQDRDLRYTWVYNPNPQLREDAIIGKTDADLHGESQAASLTALKRRVLESGQGARGEFRLACEGAGFLYDVTVEPLRGANGLVTGLVGRALEITRRGEREEEERHAHLNRLVDLLLASKDILAAATVEGLLQDVADRARELIGACFAITGLGYAEGVFRAAATSQASDVSAPAPSEAFSPANGRAWLDLIYRTGSLRLTDVELRAHSAWWGLPLGPASPRGLLGTRLAGAQDEPAGLIILSDKREGEFSAEDEALLSHLATIASLGLRHIEARALAERRADELERFAYTISHDLKAPLITIKGFVDLLSTDVARGDLSSVPSYTTHVDKAADRMMRLLDDLLNLARVGRAANPPENASLSDMAHEAAHIVGGRVAQRGVDVRIAEDMPVVRVDRMRIVQVFQNLIDNAVKFMGGQPQPVIEIGASRQGGETVAYVKDNGIGIKPESQEKIFDLFTKAGRGSEGTGVGLALVRKIVEVYGGRVWVESEGPGKGAKFCFTLGRAMGEPRDNALPAG